MRHWAGFLKAIETMHEAHAIFWLQIGQGDKFPLTANLQLA